MIPNGRLTFAIREQNIGGIHIPSAILVNVLHLRPTRQTIRKRFITLPLK